ncbi:U7 snRNA-associated Sm-like protein LSm11 [Limulus polyphemus]|uniref:U7 snRNA-associated Sm-like protein LSm11 n=1 Tax=Limulus polyphemus TaxID=6850 RepID=A0ABM1B8Y0_LIMPO|nr:U7 snRNA-associated Sm-like protein LSm11 [Limulus polyphemus]
MSTQEHDKQILDLTSPEFDALTALQNPGNVILPCPNARTFNNIAEYTTFAFGRKERETEKNTDKTGSKSKLKKEIRPTDVSNNTNTTKARTASTVTVTTPGSSKPCTSTIISDPVSESGDTTFTLLRTPILEQHSKIQQDGRVLPTTDFPFFRPQNRKVLPDVLKKMKTGYNNGPLGMLNKCVQNQTRVKVWTRNFNELRGICTGFIVAFDKHWNLAMVDVDEVYLKHAKRKTPFISEVASPDFEEHGIGVNLLCDFDYYTDSESTQTLQYDDSISRQETCEELFKVREEKSFIGDSSFSEFQVSQSKTQTENREKNLNIQFLSEKLAALTQKDKQNTEELSVKQHSSTSQAPSTSETRIAENIHHKTKNTTHKPQILDKSNRPCAGPTCTRQSLMAQMLSSVSTVHPLQDARRNKKRNLPQLMRRHVNQLFVRGDNVVVVSIIKV